MKDREQRQQEAATWMRVHKDHYIHNLLTRKHHVCDVCELVIPKGSRVLGAETAPFKGVYLCDSCTRLGCYSATV